MSNYKLDRIAESLAERGADPERLDLVDRARRFKRSWVEMAEGLVRVRDSRAYERWGYPDIHAYCAQELQIRSATVDKLLLSYLAVRRHAPRVLERDGVDEPLPAMDAVDYFARAVGTDAANDAPEPVRDAADEVVEELRHAVFDERSPVAVLRRRFDPVLFPKPDGAEELSSLRKADGAARRLLALLDGVDGLSRRRVREVSAALEGLREDLAPLLESARERVREAS